ncbi:indole-3-glycerol phosphate synthase TrpC [Metabacillus idriensis]|uniref:Indole-3-glycerol phosphate synthase n=1 Tax=Metabacillus idriensis TaxID=324768 RepID=A0A6I2MBC7_9BACI|nr:indole-3-glycerol phosphate synthase TrpC [Metabacillus idriensis]MCM3596948.1 indole-3-glycerol phosphate synthase TrpC [Metabacillus idriensis]MRX55705.1 indole-3-glycerol phosphate synthase TrpC [Metabacillus idriensis]OHR74586.1 indole-3-glycerol phosphate synthase [Bacillus sp. HMSC76G11]
MLTKILEKKREEVLSLTIPERTNVSERSFYSALKHSNRKPALIAEVKKASPSKGIIKENFHPVEIAKAYEAGKADCLSVLTDESFFQGHRDFIVEIKKEVSLPVLRKDFIIDHKQVEESRNIGADAILLIGEALEAKELHELYVHAYELGMDVLVEVHSLAVLEKLMSEFTPKILGVNNRDLSTFKTNIHQIKTISTSVPKDTLLVSESGIFTFEDVKTVQQEGAHAILVGESLMRGENQTAAIKALYGEENE